MGLARASSGSANACVAFTRQDSSSCGYTHFSRREALREASSIAAVVSTASTRAAAAQARSRAGLGRASLRQRSSVAAATPTCNETSPIESLSGGSNPATALSLNACPYRATSTPLKPPHSEFYSGDNNSGAGGWCEGLKSGLPFVRPDLTSINSPTQAAIQLRRPDSVPTRRLRLHRCSWRARTIGFRPPRPKRNRDW